MALRSQDDRAPGFRSVGCDRILGYDKPAGLEGVRAVALGHRLARVRAGPVCTQRGLAPGVRPVLPADDEFVTSLFAAAAAAAVVAMPFGAMHWRSLGPSIGGGRVAAVAGSNADASLYYFGAADGGVWKTTDGGATWSDVWG